MPFELRAFIAAKKTLDAVAGGLRGARVTELAHGLALLPLTASLEAEFGRGKEPAPFKGLRLSAGLAEWARKASESGPIAYVEADYGPGRDFQAGATWSAGALSTGPLLDKTAWDPREPAMLERPINTVLRALGVAAQGYGDEWDAVALARHSRTEDWAK